MEKLKTMPKSDGFYMPAEFEKHQGTVMIWPERAGSWGKNPYAAQLTFSKLIKEISKREKVYVAVSKNGFENAKKMLSDTAELWIAKTDDSWARDTAPTFVINNKREIRGIDWKFNAWGGDYDGLYRFYENDNKFAEEVSKKTGIQLYDAGEFVLEGGSIHSDGEGTILVTEACLLSKGRNPQLTKCQIEEKLKEYLGAEKVIWLPFGIYNDETNEHVDNVAAFIRPAEIVLAWTDDKNDPQYEMSKKDYEVLMNETDAKGRSFIVHKLPIPDKTVSFNEKDCEGFEFEDGEDVRDIGERLAASYVNFYFANGIILMPAFRDGNEESDERAKRILESICPERKIIMIDAYHIIRGGGNIHCITQQIPEGIIE